MPGSTPIVGDVLQVRAVCFSLDQISLNITHWRVVSVAGAGVNLFQISGQFRVDLAEPYKALMPPAASFRGFGVTNLSGDRSVEEADVTSAGIGSVAGTNLVPEQVSAVISWKTRSAGKHFRGRIYPGFLSAGFIDTAGRLNGAGRTALDVVRLQYGFVKTVTNGGDQATLQLVILHRATPARPIPPNSLTTDVTASTRSEQLGTQRRRGDYGPTNQPPF
jgi:hypothetical protein